MTVKQCRDAALALCLLFVALAIFKKRMLFFGAALFVAICAFTAPRIFTPIAFLAGAVGRLATSALSLLCLTMVYFTALLPVALFLRIIGNDPMACKKWKEGKESVFIDRRHTFGPQDMEHPY